MAPVPAHVRRQSPSTVADTTDPLKIGSAKWNEDLEVFLGSVCEALAALDIGADKIAYFNSASSAALTTLTAFGRLLVASNDDGGARALLSAVGLAGDTMAGDLNMGGFHKVTGLAAPSGATDAVRKADLDAVITVASGAMAFQTDWDPTTGAFPATNKDGGAVTVGNIWKVDSDGTCGGKFFSAGDDLYAVVDNPSTTTYAGNWLKVEGSITLAEVQSAIGFTFGSLAALSSITASLISDATANGRSLITASNYAAMRTLLGLGSAALKTANTTATAGDVIQWDAGNKYPPGDASQLTGIGALPVMIVTEQQASGTNSQGSQTAATWNVRPLNNTVANTISGASLSSNAVTLPAGTYECEWSTPASSCDNHQSQLLNATDGITLVYGSSEFAPNGTALVTRSFGRGKFTLAAPKVLQVLQRFTTGGGGVGVPGRAASTGNAEVYTIAQFTKIG